MSSDPTRAIETPDSTPPDSPTSPIPTGSHPYSPETVALQPVGAGQRRPARMRTVVLGVVLMVVAVVAILNLTTSVHPDPGTVVLGLLIGCGVLLIVGARRE